MAAVREIESQQGQPIGGQAGGGRSWLRSRWSVPCLFTGLGVLLFFAYFVEASDLPIFADGSSQALQAWDMVHGNLLLHGWVLSDVAFYTTEVPQYMLIELVRGLNPDVVHIAAAMTYALLVVLAAILAKGKATGREALVRVLIVVGIMVAPPFGRILASRGYSTAWILLSAPDHTGTQVPLVLAWLMIDRLRSRWWLPVAVTALLALVEIADSTAVYEGALPIVIVCVARVYRRRAPLAEQMPDLALATGALGSIGLATTALNVIRLAGGFAVNPASASLISINGMTANFWLKLHSILVLFGADFFGLSVKDAAVPALHLIAVALVVWGVVRAARRVFSEDDLGMQIVTVSFLVLLAAFMFGYRTGAREAVGLLPLGAVLAGRMLAGRVFDCKLVPALGAVLAVFALTLGFYDAQPALPSPAQALASWLKAHHLTYGLSRNWYSSNGVTLYTQGQVKVRDVLSAPDGRLVRERWNTQAAWYNPRQHDATFAILNPCVSALPTRLFAAEGQPTAIYHVDNFTVVVWRHANLLASHPQVGPRGAPQPKVINVNAGNPTARDLMCEGG